MNATVSKPIFQEDVKTPLAEWVYIGKTGSITSGEMGSSGPKGPFSYAEK